MKGDPSRPLRQGFTTGSAAAAAAKAAAMGLLGLDESSATVSSTSDDQSPAVRPDRAAERDGLADRADVASPAEGLDLSGVLPRAAGGGATWDNKAVALETVASGCGAPKKAGLEVATHRSVDIPLPGGGRLVVPLESVQADGWAWVVKDAGDDPDATHGARIGCRVELLPRGPAGAVFIEGGAGVGRVTLPGLPVPPGQAAINPVPRRQIADAVGEALRAGGFTGAARVTVMVENGEAIARRTLNPRLGILGGISILGTAGIVKPFSHEAWRATITSGLAVARAAGLTTCAFSTGRRSERMLMAHCPGLPLLAFVQAADFFAFSLRSAVELGFTEIVWGCFFGKLVKMAQGLEYTHAHAGATDFALLAELAAQAVQGVCEAEAESAAHPAKARGRGGEAPVAALPQAVARANTARHALELVEPQEARRVFAGLTAQRSLDAARVFAGPGPRLRLVCFGFEQGVLSDTEG